jgi:hypothetical protein
VGLDAVNNAMDAVDAAAPIRNSNVPITPARVGYLTYTDWAEKVNQQFQTAIDKSLSVGDGGDGGILQTNADGASRRSKEAEE